jgi:four helix bundle protein
VSDFRKLKVWRKAHALVLNVHPIARRINGSDYAPLRSQMLRAAMSIPTNIVEGAGQRTGREFGRFIRIALNSSSEFEYHLMAARDLDLITFADFESLQDQTTQVRRMLYGLLAHVTDPSRSPPRQVKAS